LTKHGLVVLPEAVQNRVDPLGALLVPNHPFPLCVPIRPDPGSLSQAVPEGTDGVVDYRAQTQRYQDGQIVLSRHPREERGAHDQQARDQHLPGWLRHGEGVLEGGGRLAPRPTGGFGLRGRDGGPCGGGSGGLVLDGRAGGRHAWGKKGGRGQMVRGRREGRTERREGDRSNEDGIEG